VTTVTLPNTITAINASAFRYSSLTSINIPSTVTSIGNYAFASCSSLADITIPSSVTTLSLSALSGGSCRTGVAIVEGDLAGGGGYDYGFNGSGLILYGSWDVGSSGGVPPFGGNVKFCRIGGNLKLAGSAGGDFGMGLVDAGMNNNSSFEFVELMGIFQGRVIFSTGASRYIKYGTIIHLGYEGMACQASQACVSNINIEAIYIGPGESEAGDQAIIDTYYLTDTSWANYSSKLHTWYSYVHGTHGDGKYANSPF